MSIRQTWRRWRGPRTMEDVGLDDAIAMFVQNRRGRRLTRRLVRP